MKINLSIHMLITLCFASFVGLSSLIADELPNNEHPKSKTDNRQPFVHATYLVGDRIKDLKQLEQTRFEQFNFMYVMAAPPWKADDFDMSENDVMNKLLRDYSYPTAGTGRALVPELISRAHRKKVKLLLSIPGSKQFNPIASDTRKRALFAQVMAAFVKKYDYDGIEIDWEHTVNVDQHTALMEDLRNALSSLNRNAGSPSRKYYLTTALQSYRKYSKTQAQRLSRSVDWINIMTYDMGGGIWGRAPSHNTPLDEMERILRDNWSEFAPDKICIGLANYGFLYKGISPGQKSETSLKEKGRYFSYTELPTLLKGGWQESYDTRAEAPYYFSPDKTNFVTIDNNRSHSRKLEWVFKEHYRGVFWWEFHCDYFPPVEGLEYATHPLIDPVTETIKTFEQNSVENRRERWQ